MCENMSIIKATNASHAYKSANNEYRLSIDNIELTINRGEYIAVLGENGSGKSTLGKMINALLEPISGTVYVNGKSTSDEKNHWDIHKTVGMIFQNPDNQIVATVVEDDIAFGLENIGVPTGEIRTRVHEALSSVSMQDEAQKEPHLLSGGQKQRMAIAGVLAMKPDVIVLDEPTAMLDPIGKREINKIVKELNESHGITIIYITHSINEALKAKRAIILENGKIVADGSPEIILTDAKKLMEFGVEVPQMTQISMYLNKHGVMIPKEILTVEEMVDKLCQLL